MKKSPRKYWRRSSRWRAAWKNARPGTLDRYRLHALAEGWKVFGPKIDPAPIMWREADRFSGDIMAWARVESSWLGLVESAPFPEVPVKPLTNGFLKRVFNELKKFGGSLLAIGEPN